MLLDAYSCGRVGQLAVGRWPRAPGPDGVDRAPGSPAPLGWASAGLERLADVQARRPIPSIDGDVSRGVMALPPNGDGACRQQQRGARQGEQLNLATDHQRNRVSAAPLCIPVRPSVACGRPGQRTLPSVAGAGFLLSEIGDLSLPKRHRRCGSAAEGGLHRPGPGG